MIPNPIPAISVRQNELPDLLASYRITTHPVAARSWRETEAGGFADQDRYPYTWTVYFLVDGQWAHVESARGLRREWSSLDRLEKWLRRMGFRFFWVRNDIEPAEEDQLDPHSGLSFK
ncbi:hypothetical protein [Paracoccus marinaquae]|uniref:Uncharacterized protein n=1 Tax=Paracoccus marinaquae TaxID=2841926 RepID=A0ABS6AR11_9RHOB|nr:hypothetical protein [Paracoccus marinaquae]MBU3032302.1 hypothetical protein [Paracoccus marinaquae]